MMSVFVLVNDNTVCYTVGFDTTAIAGTIPQHTSVKKDQIYNRNLNSELFLPLIVIKITGLPCNTMKFVPPQEQFGTFTVSKMQAGKKKENHSFTLSELAADTCEQQN